jgi:hypothetical protein
MESDAENIKDSNHKFKNRKTDEIILPLPTIYSIHPIIFYSSGVCSHIHKMARYEMPIRRSFFFLFNYSTELFSYPYFFTGSKLLEEK